MDVSPDADLVSDEIFGPVAAIQTFSSEDEVIERANASPFGLASYIYTQDLSRGLRVAERLEAGMVGLNRGLVSDPAAPFGGVKQSGLGREGGHEGVMEYLETQYVSRLEEHTSELQSLMRTSYAVFCLKKKNTTTFHVISSTTSQLTIH